MYIILQITSSECVMGIENVKAGVITTCLQALLNEFIGRRLTFLVILGLELNLGNKAKGQISKWMLQENKARQTF